MRHVRQPGFGLGDLVFALALLSMLGVMWFQAAATWTRQEAMIQRRQTMWRLAESQIEQLRADPIKLQAGEQALNFEGQRLPTAGRLLVEPVAGRAGLVRVRVEVTGPLVPRGQPQTVWLESDLFASGGGAR